MKLLYYRVNDLSSSFYSRGESCFLVLGGYYLNTEF